LQIYTNANYQASARVSSLAAGQLDFFFFSRNNAQLAGCPDLAISVTPQASGDPDLYVSNRPFSATGACSSVAGTYCASSTSSGMDTVSLASTQTTTGYFYVAVVGFGSSDVVYTLSLTWRGSSGACGMFPFIAVFC
jgi:hypothetical protein